MPFALRILRRASADIDDKFESLRRHLGRAAAVRWRAKLEACFMKLEELPSVWPLADEAEELGVDLRNVLFGKRRHVYRVLFSFDGTTISVHRIRHAAQDRLTKNDL